MQEYNKSNGGLKRKMLLTTLLPMIVLIIVIMGTAFIVVRQTVVKEISNELESVGNVMIEMYDNLYPGDYRCVETSSKQLAIYKGDKFLNGDYGLIDRVAAQNDVEITFFYHELRVLTTIKDAAGERIIESNANIKVRDSVLQKGNRGFFDGIGINGASYCCYYIPLKDNKGSIVGMLAVAKTMESVNWSIISRITPIFIACILGALFIGFCIVKTTKSVVGDIESIEGLLKGIADGKLDGAINGNVLKNNDELSSIGYSALEMQKNLRELVELDVLTQINNRRSGEAKLHKAMEDSINRGMPLSIVIGDIDFFKKFNDTYGHDCGDEVLITVAGILKKEMGDKGFVARWGGEEFLVVYDKRHYKQSVKDMNDILQKIRDTVINYKDTSVSVTMSFGITEYTGDEEAHILLKRADEHLYFAKEHGRNQVVSDEIYEAGNREESDLEEIKMTKENEAYNASIDLNSEIDFEKILLENTES